MVKAESIYWNTNKMHSTMKRELSHEIAFRKSIPQYKDVHWLHHRYYKNEHKNVEYH